MFSKGHIVNISGKTYCIGELTKSSMIEGSQEFIRNQIRESEEFRSRISKEWVKIGSKEYKITYAYGGERMNVIYREPGNTGPIYNILFSDDAETLLYRRNGHM
jgi:hypothetical protein